MDVDDAAVGATTVIMSMNGWEELQVSLPRHEGPVILVDNGSSDGTPGSVREQFPHVRVVELGVNRGAVARNVGVELAETEVVAFADDDSWWEPGALERAAELFRRNPRLGLIAGRILVGEDEREDPICSVMAESPLPADADLPGRPVLGFLACGAIVRREAFLAAGGFDDIIFFFGEEERLALDLVTQRWGVVYLDSIVARHRPVPSESHAGRRALAARNRLLTAALRRPWPVVIQTAVALVREGPDGRSGVRSAIPRLPRALRARRRIPPRVERLRRMLDAS